MLNASIFERKEKEKGHNNQKLTKKQYTKKTSKIKVAEEGGK